MILNQQYKYYFPDGIPAAIAKRENGSNEEDLPFAASEYFDDEDEVIQREFSLPAEFNDMIKEAIRSIQDIRYENVQVNQKFHSLLAIHSHAQDLTKIISNSCDADQETNNLATSAAIKRVRSEAIYTYNSMIKSLEFLTFNSFYAQDLLSSLHEDFESRDFPIRKKIWDKLQEILNLTETLSSTNIESSRPNLHE